MKNVMLIDVATVKKTGYVHENILPNTISTTIRRVQETMLKRVMTKFKYIELLDKVSASLPPTSPVVPLDAETEDLLTNYIQPYLVACVDYRIIYPLTIRHRSKSVGKGRDENHDPADLTELVRLKDQMAQDVKAYEEDLLDKLLHLNEVDTLGPLCCDEHSTHRKHKSSSQHTQTIKFK
jgi:hypothetical protein